MGTLLAIGLGLALGFNKEVKSNSTGGTPPADPWILTGGIWNDSGIWIDEETWNDGV